MPDKHIDTLVINAAECEPYITVDYRECIDNSWDIMSGIFTIKEILGIDNVVIAVEDNKPAAFEVLNRIAENSNDIGDHVKLMALKSLYPQGAEKMMVQSATGRRVPPGKLPADVGCIVMNGGQRGVCIPILKIRQAVCLPLDHGRRLRHQRAEKYPPTHRHPGSRT